MESLSIQSAGSFQDMPSRDTVLGWLGCAPDAPCHAVFSGAYDTAVSRLRNCMQPCAVLVRGDPRSLTVFLSLGPEPEKTTGALFAAGEYILGSVMDTLCDGTLFQMDRTIAGILEKKLEDEHRYLSAREDPGESFPLSEQVQAIQSVRTVLPYVSISGHGILTPVKSMLIRVRLSETPCAISSLHDCSMCTQEGCVYRDTQPHVPSGKH